MDKQIIYNMSGVGKVYGKKHVLKNISLGYYYGAKIGVLGLNGSGKSTLLKILAGLDDNHLGQTTLSKGYSVGYLEQEPNLDPEKTVMEFKAFVFALRAGNVPRAPAGWDINNEPDLMQLGEILKKERPIDDLL